MIRTVHFRVFILQNKFLVLKCEIPDLAYMEYLKSAQQLTISLCQTPSCEDESIAGCCNNPADRLTSLRERWSVGGYKTEEYSIGWLVIAQLVVWFGVVGEGMVCRW